MLHNIVSIEKHPKIVDLKERIGDWEVSLIIGSKQKETILTIVERVTQFVFLF